MLAATTDDAPIDANDLIQQFQSLFQNVEVNRKAKPSVSTKAVRNATEQESQLVHRFNEESTQDAMTQQLRGLTLRQDYKNACETALKYCESLSSILYNKEHPLWSVALKAAQTEVMDMDADGQYPLLVALLDVIQKAQSWCYEQSLAEQIQSIASRQANVSRDLITLKKSLVEVQMQQKRRRDSMRFDMPLVDQVSAAKEKIESAEMELSELEAKLAASSRNEVDAEDVIEDDRENLKNYVQELELLLANKSHDLETVEEAISFATNTIEDAEANMQPMTRLSLLMKENKSQLHLKELDDDKQKVVSSLVSALEASQKARRLAEDCRTLEGLRRHILALLANPDTDSVLFGDVLSETPIHSDVEETDSEIHLERIILSTLLLNLLSNDQGMPLEALKQSVSESVRNLVDIDSESLQNRIRDGLYRLVGRKMAFIDRTTRACNVYAILNA